MARSSAPSSLMYSIIPPSPIRTAQRLALAVALIPRLALRSAAAVRHRTSGPAIRWSVQEATA